MSQIRPFRALRPNPGLAAKICELPYDVMSSEEARFMAAGNPLSFLHVSKPEIDLPANVDLHDPQVYATGRENFRKLAVTGALRRDETPCFYLYRQVMGAHAQLGLVAVASCEDYGASVIKKHELTRPDKEQDRVNHIDALNAQTGPVFLTYRARPELDALFARISSDKAEIDFAAPDGVRHQAWVIKEPAVIERIQTEFNGINPLYIADGHHRSAAAWRVWQARHGAGSSGWFLSVIFPHNQMQIMPYNRVLKDLNGRSPEAFLKELEKVFVFQQTATPSPVRSHEVGLYIGGKWHGLAFRKELTQAPNPIDRLDVSLLQQHVLAPILGIEDPRTSQRIQFVGGIRGTAELEKLVNSGAGACAFSMYPTRIEELMDIADGGGIMPPKSTWFEPKLRDGMFSHLLDEA
jgi:uncharacterized protein (DUF1015 family)